MRASKTREEQNNKKLENFQDKEIKNGTERKEHFKRDRKSQPFTIVLAEPHVTCCRDTNAE